MEDKECLAERIMMSKLFHNCTMTFFLLFILVCVFVLLPMFIYCIIDGSGNTFTTKAIVQYHTYHPGTVKPPAPPYWTVRVHSDKFIGEARVPDRLVPEMVEGKEVTIQVVKGRLSDTNVSARVIE